MKPVNLLLPTLAFLTLAAIAFCKQLNFRPDGTFTILHLTDIHYAEGEENDAGSMMLQDKFIKRVKPDMVMVTGDTISSYEYTGQPNFVKDAWSKFTKSFSDNQVYYAFALGNHDASEGITNEDIYAEEKNCPYSLLAEANNIAYNIFTYYLPVYSSIDKDKVSSMLWVFNSKVTQCEQEPNSWGCIDQDQIKWYSDNSKAFKQANGDGVHNLGFMHIPLPEFMDLHNDHEYIGYFNGDVSCPLVNTGLFDALKKNGDIQAIFAGHDHQNDFSGFLDNIELIYGRRMGYGGWHNYGAPRGGFQRGARVVTLTEKKNADGSIDVTRDHYVIVEDPTLDDDEDLAVQRKKKRRNGWKQYMCDPAGGFENVLTTNLPRIAMVIAFLVTLGLFMNLLINVVRKCRYSKLVEDQYELGARQSTNASPEIRGMEMHNSANRVNNQNGDVEMNNSHDSVN